MHVKYL